MANPTVTFEGALAEHSASPGDGLELGDLRGDKKIFFTVTMSDGLHSDKII